METVRVKRELEEKELEFLVSLLDPRDKSELVNAFSDVFRDMMKEGLLSKSWYYKLLNGLSPSDELVLKACHYDNRVVGWVIERAKEKVNKANEILSRL